MKVSSGILILLLAAPAASAAQVADEAFEARDPYLGGLCFFRKGHYIAGFANLPAGARSAELTARLAARLP